MQAPAITTALAGIRQAEQIEAAAQAHRILPMSASVSAPPPDVTIRLARPDDAAALQRLAQLDGRETALSGDPLVAVVDGTIVAARGLRGGIVSDPFRARAELIALLDVRAEQLAGRGARPRPARSPRRTMPVLRVGGAR